MLLVVDAEVIFASLIKSGFTLDMIRLLRERGYELVTPEYIFEEVKRKEDKLLKYSKLNPAKLEYILSLSLKKIEPVPMQEYSTFLKKAKKISPPEDFPYTALALRYKSSGSNARIWSNDARFREMTEGSVPFISTQELAKELGLI